MPFHIGITTPDLTASMRAVGDALGVTWTPPTTPDGVLHTVAGEPQPRPTSCVSREGPIHIDLIQGGHGTVWETDHPQMHHFAYWTDDLPGDVDRLAHSGWRLEMTQPDAVGRPSVFAYLRRDDGFRVELIDASGRDDYYARLAQRP